MDSTVMMIRCTLASLNDVWIIQSTYRISRVDSTLPFLFRKTFPKSLYETQLWATWTFEHGEWKEQKKKKQASDQSEPSLTKWALWSEIQGATDGKQNAFVLSAPVLFPLLKPLLLLLIYIFFYFWMFQVLFCVYVSSHTPLTFALQGETSDRVFSIWI